MYNPKEITAGFLGMIGLRQNYNTSDFVIADSLLNSEFGQYYQDFHPMLTLDNLKAIAPSFENTELPTWDPSVVYRIGDRVVYSSQEYRRIHTDGSGDQPDIVTQAWERFNPFSEWLEDKIKASILKALRDFWDSKMADKKAKNILENKSLFEGAGRLADAIPNSSNIVGLEIVPIRAKGVSVKIDKIGLQFTGATDITLYLMHSSRKGVLKALTFTRTRDAGMEWFAPTEDLRLPYESSEVDSGGSWFLAYKQSELGAAQAINKSKDWSKKPCLSCNSGELAAWNVWSKYLEVHPFKVSEFIDPLVMWDVSENLYTYESNYGINLQLTIECDMTDIFLEQRRAFQNVIGLQMASDMLREFAYNPNFNIGRAQQNFSRNELLYEIDGDSQGYKKSGINYELGKALKAIDVDFSQMSRVCLPCGNRGIKYRAT